MSITSKIKYRSLTAKGKIIKYSRATPVKFQVLKIKSVSRTVSEKLI